MTVVPRPSPALEPHLLADSLGWDVVNWGRATTWCQARSRLEPGGTALEVGADGENGGVSLILAAQGWTVTCSGLEPPSDVKRELHRRYGVEDRVAYQRLDVLDPPCGDTYDLVVVKSTLGHVGQDQRFDLQRRAVRNLRARVRPGGELWVLENAAATRVHRSARLRLGAARHGWRYLTPDELDVLLAPFDGHERAAFGVAGAGGRTERQRALLGRLDAELLDHLTPPSWRYVLAGVARVAPAA